MIDLALLRRQPDQVKQALTKKDPTLSLDDLIAKDEHVRALQVAVEELRHQKKSLSTGPVNDDFRKRSIELGKRMKALEQELSAAQEALDAVWLNCPNIPQDMVPVGDKESNQSVREWGSKRACEPCAKNHIELNKVAQWFDMAAATKMSGSQFVLYKERGTKVLYALTQLMLKNNAIHGYIPVIPPYLVTERALYNSGNLPKFRGDFYEMSADGLCLIPTAEVSLTNVHAGEIIPAEELPKRYAAWTSCFRREAGGYGAQERGLIRIHQFEKVEIYALTRPEESDAELDRMIACAEKFLQMLGLHYRVSLLAGQDCSFSSAKTYDIEVWLSGQDKYYEVSSASNCTDFQARRAKIRYRSAEMKKPQLVHTLNASSLALPRLMVALMEQGQRPDGSIVLPDVLQQMIDSLW